MRDNGEGSRAEKCSVMPASPSLFSYQTFCPFFFVRAERMTVLKCRFETRPCLCACMPVRACVHVSVSMSVRASMRASTACVRKAEVPAKYECCVCVCRAD